MKRIMRHGIVIVILGLLIGCGEDLQTETLEDKIKTPVKTPMVLIPAGEFQMGTDSSEIPDLVQWLNDRWVDDHSDLLFDRETPLHTVYLDSFYMDIYEVTNAQYRKFMEATGHSAPGYWSVSSYNAPEHPVVGVNWHDAVAYAEWVGKRLPTEAEWEKAARGGLSGKRYPWGDEISRDGANYSGTGGKDIWSYAAPVGSFAPNSYGLYDMVGNVREWCADWYDSGYYINSPYNNPLGADSGRKRVLRGGSWGHSPCHLRCASRYHPCYPTNMGSSVGFRCVSQGSSDVTP